MRAQRFDQGRLVDHLAARDVDQQRAFGQGRKLGRTDQAFGRALPLLKERGLLRREDLPRARLLLTAAAFTYVAAALQSLLNIARWWAILRR
jgi:hypothetical protein